MNKLLVCAWLVGCAALNASIVTFEGTVSIVTGANPQNTRIGDRMFGRLDFVTVPTQSAANEIAAIIPSSFPILKDPVSGRWVVTLDLYMVTPWGEWPIKTPQGRPGIDGLIIIFSESEEVVGLAFSGCCDPNSVRGGFSFGPVDHLDSWHVMSMDGTMSVEGPVTGLSYIYTPEPGSLSVAGPALVAIALLVRRRAQGGP